jgi:hypothetical protein
MLWLLSRGSPTQPDTGSYTMTLTPGAPTAMTSGQYYAAATGVIDAVLQPATQTGATGTVMLHVAF